MDLREKEQKKRQKTAAEAAAVIAAAGLSSRMGALKQTMKLGEYGFTERIVRSFFSAPQTFLCFGRRQYAVFLMCRCLKTGGR